MTLIQRSIKDWNTRFAGLFVAMALAAGLCWAQVATGTISGAVRDSSGAALAGASVTATNRETGLSRTVRSGLDGHYQFSSLPAGLYDLRSEAMGFQTRVQQGLNLSVGEESVMNFSMSVGAVQETVTVVAEAPLIEWRTIAGVLPRLCRRSPRLSNRSSILPPRAESEAARSPAHRS